MKIKKKLRQWYLDTLLIPYLNVFYPKLYTSIYDTPAYIWEEFNHEQDETILLDLIINPKRRKDKWLKSSLFIKYQLSPLWELLTEQNIDKFPPDQYLKQLALRKKIALYYWKAEAYNQRALRTKARLLEEQLNKPVKFTENNFYDNCVNMEERLGIKIDSRKISIFEYRNKIIVLSKSNGSNKRGTTNTKSATRKG